MIKAKTVYWQGLPPGFGQTQLNLCIGNHGRYQLAASYGHTKAYSQCGAHFKII